MLFKYLEISNKPSEELRKLLKTNVIGTPGISMLYQHMQVEKKLDLIPVPYFVHLNKCGKTIGVCCFCSRVTLNSQKRISSFYIRYFTFHEKYRRKKVMKQNQGLKNATNKIKADIVRLLSGDGLNKQPADQFFYYAYVDKNNLRSTLLCNDFNFEAVRQFSTILFHRFYPQLHRSVTPLAPEEIEAMKPLLQEFYKAHTMFSFENIFNRGHYFVIKDDDGQILVGAQVDKEYWNILDLPNRSGKFMLHYLSNLPLFEKLIQKEYHFISIEAIYFRAGFEYLLEELFETLLAIYKVNTAMMCVDSDSELYSSIKAIDLGLLSKIQQEVQANVICFFNGFDAGEINQFKNRPAYISVTDLT